MSQLVVQSRANRMLARAPKVQKAEMTRGELKKARLSEIFCRAHDYRATGLDWSTSLRKSWVASTPLANGYSFADSLFVKSEIALMYGDKMVGSVAVMPEKWLRAMNKLKSVKMVRSRFEAVAFAISNSKHNTGGLLSLF